MSARPRVGATKLRWLPWQGDLYIATTVAAAVALAVLTYRLWPHPLLVNPWLWAELVVLGAVAVNFPLEVGSKMKLTVTVAVYFCALLVFPTPAALAAVAIAQLAGSIAVNLRLKLQGRKPRGGRSVVFNTAQLVVVFAIASLTYHVFVQRVAPAPLDRIENLWALPLTAATLYLVNSLAVAIMAGIQLGRNPAEIWLTDQRLDSMQYAALFLVGLVAALVATRYAFGPLVMSVPTVLIYLSLRRTHQLVDQTISAIESMAAIVDMRDSYTSEHSERVAALATRIARRMGVAGQDIEHIRLAGRVHDLGKIGIPDYVLLKPGRLDADERSQMERHPQLGYDILSRFPEYKHGRELVRAHHERFDGKGYPRQLCGGEIPLGAQIIAVADAFDAMTSDRPYRRRMSEGEALHELREGSGTQWHPRVVEAIADVLDAVERRVPAISVVASA